MADITVAISGLDQLQARLQEVAAGAIQKAGRALREEAELIMTRAKERTPVLTGALRASGTVTGPEGAEMAVKLSFGGPAAPYAVFVHENLDAHHPHGGEAKFLESAVLEASADLPDRLAARMGSM